ncbi:gluconokinase [Isoptericola variabilis]|uniref:gluconokinase n=1 Tax=Isoptericola variabilis TaxID=139208 RepID=UPI0002FF1D4E|nr:gluconokinase [Isoptericola variabilis]
MSTDRQHTGPRAVVVVGVSASGKSTVGRALADALGAAFVDADDLHPASNVEAMAAGIPLTDEQRLPWLRAVGRAMRTETDAGRDVVVACSALRRTYRDVLREGAGHDLAFVHLTAPREVLAERIAARRGHFMPASLLDSQLATLEPLSDDETGLVVDVTGPVSDAVGQVTAWLPTIGATSRTGDDAAATG